MFSDASRSENVNIIWVSQTGVLQLSAIHRHIRGLENSWHADVIAHIFHSLAGTKQIKEKGEEDMTSKNKMICASFFAGVGGIDLGFELTGYFRTVYANEFDRYPTVTYNENFAIKADCRDIHDVNPEDFPDVDVIMGGFPCQAFSIAGKREGFADERGRGVLFFEMLRLIKAKKPKAVFFENVKNLVTHDGGRTFEIIMKSLREVGYHCTSKVMNAMEYGNIPQNRERIYIVGFRDEEDFKRFSFPEPVALTTPLSDVIDFSGRVPEKYYYTLGKYANNLYEKLDAGMDDPKAVYQWRRHYVRKNKSGVVPTLTANQGEGGHNVCIVRTKYGIRKMTPAECFYTQGFPKTYRLPEMTDSRLYKQAGNSVCVSVIERIAEQMAKALNHSDICGRCGHV